MTIATAILQLICPDRAGLVSELSGWVAANGGNIVHADHHSDHGAGLFLSRIEWELEGFGLPREEICPAARALFQRLQPKGIELRPESYGWSVIQALFSRSDRRLAPVIAAVGSQNNSLGGWKKAYREHANTLPPWQELIHNTWSTSVVLPWDHLDGPLTKATLVGHLGVKI